MDEDDPEYQKQDAEVGHRHFVLTRHFVLLSFLAIVFCVFFFCSRHGHPVGFPHVPRTESVGGLASKGERRKKEWHQSERAVLCRFGNGLYGPTGTGRIGRPFRPQKQKKRTWKKEWRNEPSDPTNEIVPFLCLVVVAVGVGCVGSVTDLTDLLERFLIYFFLAPDHVAKRSEETVDRIAPIGPLLLLMILFRAVLAVVVVVVVVVVVLGR